MFNRLLDYLTVMAAYVPSGTDGGNRPGATVQLLFLKCDPWAVVDHSYLASAKLVSDFAFSFHGFGSDRLTRATTKIGLKRVMV